MTRQPCWIDECVYSLAINTANILNEQQDNLRKICWTNGEANLDTWYSKLACECCYKAWDVMKYTIMEYSDISIIHNYLSNSSLEQIKKDRLINDDCSIVLFFYCSIIHSFPMVYS